MLHFTSSKRFMGSFVNPFPLQVIVWLLAVFFLGVNIYLIQDFVTVSLKPTLRLCVQLSSDPDMRMP